MVKCFNIKLVTIIQTQYYKYTYTVLQTMNLKYRNTLGESKKLNGSGLLNRAGAKAINADVILYNYAIQMVGVLELNTSFPFILKYVVI